MKTKSIVALLLSILLIMSVFAACKKSDSTSSTSDEAATTTSASESTTATSTSQPTTESSATDTTAATETSSVPATTVSPTEKENNNVEVNNNNQSNSNNNSNGNNNTNSNSNNNNSNSNNKPTQTKPIETKPQVITDDTPLTYEMANNAEVFQRLCDISNSYFCTLGMTYDPTMTPDNSGWYYGHKMANAQTSILSFNERNSRNLEFIKGQVDHILIEYDGATYDKLRYNTVYEIDAKGNYNVIFCYG